MSEKFYQDLKQCFIDIRFLHTDGKADADRLDAAIGVLRYSRKQIDKRVKKKDRELLLYCIDTMIEIIGEQNGEKIFDFADTVHNIPEIFLGTRNFYSFKDEIDTFRKKYGDKYFKELNKIYPRFTKKMPKNWYEYFSPTSDDDFKSKHPVGYVLLASLGILGLVGPLGVYLTAISAAGVPSTNGWIALGGFGCFVFGVGLFNIVAAVLQQYLGHLLTAISLGSGTVMVAVSLLMIFDIRLSSLFDPDLISLYFVSLGALLFTLIFYLLFRWTVDEWINRKKHISPSKISRMKKGFTNYWWYQKLHKSVGLGAFYYFNKLYTLTFCLAFISALILGLVRTLAVVPVVLCLLVFFLCGIMNVFTHIQHNLEVYGTPIVLFERGPTGGIHSIFTDMFFIGFMFVFMYAYLTASQDILGICVPPLFSLIFGDR